MAMQRSLFAIMAAAIFVMALFFQLSFRQETNISSSYPRRTPRYKIVQLLHDVNSSSPTRDVPQAPPSIEPRVNELQVDNSSISARPRVVPPTTPPSDPEAVTCAAKSTYTIVNLKREYRLCDRVEIVIEARDKKGRRKQYGGDYFRVRLFNDKLKAGASADGVEYIGDGIYKAYFRLRWHGQTNVRVTLAQPAEAVGAMIRARRDLPSRYGYTGRFVRTTGNTTVTEDTLCNIHPPSPTARTCDLSNKRIGAPWFCSAPAKINCSDFAWTAGSKNYADKLTASLQKPVDKIFFNEGGKVVPPNGSAIVQTKESGGTASCSVDALQPCRVGSYDITVPSAAGYFLNTQWYSNHCRLQRFSTESANKCLRNKTIFIHGDSTGRQYYEFLVANLKDTLKPNPPTKQSNWKVGPSLAEDKVHNFTVHYRHHGYPIRNNLTNATEVQYIEDALDQLVATPDTVFMFTIWAHLTTVNMSFYEHRVRGIRAAVERLHERSPETLVVLKSANTRGEKGVIMDDWLARELDLKMRETFRDYSRIGFIDQWSMSVGLTNKGQIHPARPVIEGGIMTLLSYMCPE